MTLRPMKHEYSLINTKNKKVKDILNNVGDDDYELMKYSYKKGENHIEDLMVSQYAGTTIDDHHTLASKVLQKELFKNENMQNEIIKSLSKNGYKAMIDIEDAYSYADLPIVLFDPNGNIKKTKTEKLYKEVNNVK